MPSRQNAQGFVSAARHPRALEITRTYNAVLSKHGYHHYKTISAGSQDKSFPYSNHAKGWISGHIVALGERFLILVASLSMWKRHSSSQLKDFFAPLARWTPTSLVWRRRYIGNKSFRIEEGKPVALPISLGGNDIPPPTLEQESVILEPYAYVASSVGKGFRNKLIQAFNHWLRVPSTQLDIIVRVVEMLHNASLLVDDIEDGSGGRRGKPAAYKVFGVPQTINSANYAYFLAYEAVLGMARLPQVEKITDPECGLRFIQILNDEMLTLHRGQGIELYWRDHHYCPTEEEYMGMVRGKTGGLLRIAVRLMIECATSIDHTANISYITLVDLLGVWFQVYDDYMNLQSDAYMDQKGFAEDLTEGKFSFPVIHGIRTKPDNKYIPNMLRQRTQDPTVKREMISHLKEVTHSFEYTIGVLLSLEVRARSQVTILGENPTLEALLDKLAV